MEGGHKKLEECDAHKKPCCVLEQENHMAGVGTGMAIVFRQLVKKKTKIKGTNLETSPLE